MPPYSLYNFGYTAENVFLYGNVKFLAGDVNIASEGQGEPLDEPPPLGEVTAEVTCVIANRPEAPTMGWERYCGLTKVDVVRRPIEQIVREKEQAHLRAMLGHEPVARHGFQCGVDWAFEEDEGGDVGGDCVVVEPEDDGEEDDLG